jgi:glycosyltransferase involved in cell wall biosynthesis
MQKEVLIIIPAHNEEQNIGKVLDDLSVPEIAKVCDILVMNDASSDNTNWKAKKRPNVAVVSHVFNFGYGGALQLGYKYAIRYRYKYVIQMDADGQHDACNVLKIYETLKTKVNGAYPDIVLGSRYMEGSAPYPVSFMKNIAYKMFRWVIKASTGRTIMDPTTGLQGLSWRATMYYSKLGNFDDRYPDANMITVMILKGYNIVEIPGVMHVRTSGKSMHSGLKPIGYMFHMSLSILGILLQRDKYKHEPEALEKTDV